MNRSFDHAIPSVVSMPGTDSMRVLLLHIPEMPFLAPGSGDEVTKGGRDPKVLTT